jgi:Protein of unknown function (DUF1778)
MASVILNLRVDPSEKERFEEAADALGVSLTTFMLSAARRAAGDSEKKAGKRSTRPARRRVSSGAVASFFRRLIEEAGHGGKSGYRRAGAAVREHVGRLVSYATTGERKGKLGALRYALDEELEFEVLAWLEREFPSGMRLVPKRRRAQFLKGILGAWKEAG